MYRYGLWSMKCPNLVYLSYSCHGWMTRIEVYHGDWKSYRSNVGIPMNSIEKVESHEQYWYQYGNDIILGNNFGNNFEWHGIILESCGMKFGGRYCMGLG